jgi:hypothetical protein
MFAAAYIASNGVTVQYNDAGVLYTYNGHTMSFEGDGTDGEVFVDDVLHAYYNKDEIATILEDENGDEITQIDNDEDAYEGYALRKLSAL